MIRFFCLLKVMNKYHIRNVKWYHVNLKKQNLNFHRTKVCYFVFGTPWLQLAQVIICNEYWSWFDVMALLFFFFFLPFIFFSVPLCVGMECELHKCLLCHANAFMHAVWVWPCYSLSIACKIYKFLFIFTFYPFVIYFLNVDLLGGKSSCLEIIE